MVTSSYLVVYHFDVLLVAAIIIKKIVCLSPSVIILAAFIGYELASFCGIVLAIPVAVVLMEFLSDIEKDKIIARTKHESQ